MQNVQYIIINMKHTNCGRVEVIMHQLSGICTNHLNIRELKTRQPILRFRKNYDDLLETQTMPSSKSGFGNL